MTRYNFRKVEADRQKIWAGRLCEKDRRGGNGIYADLPAIDRLDFESARCAVTADVIARFQANRVIFPPSAEGFGDVFHKLGIVDYCFGNAFSEAVRCRDRGTLQNAAAKTLTLGPVLAMPCSEQGTAKRMSDGYGNVLDPLDLVRIFGADAFRLAVLSDSPPKKDKLWNPHAIESAWKYLNRLWTLFESGDKQSNRAKAYENRLEIAVGNISSAYRNRQFHKAIALLRQTFKETAPLSVAHLSLLRLFAPICPHFSDFATSRLCPDEKSH